MAKLMDINVDKFLDSGKREKRITVNFSLDSGSIYYVCIRDGESLGGIGERLKNLGRQMINDAKK